MKLFTLITCCLLALPIMPALAQQQHVYNLQVTEAGNQHPLPFFLIKDLETNFYEQGDARGKLTLRLPGKPARRIQITLLGYETLDTTINPGNLSLALRPTHMHMAQVEVATLSARTLIEQANQQAVRNYNMSPRQLIMLGHETYQDERGRSMELMATYSALVDQGKSRAEVRLEQLRSLTDPGQMGDDDFVSLPVQYTDDKSGLFAIRKEKGMKAPAVFNPAGHQLYVDSVIEEQNGRRIFIVNATPLKQEQGQHTFYSFYIEEGSFAMLRFMRATTSQGIATRQQRNQLLESGGQVQSFSDLVLAEYRKEADGFYYPSIVTGYGGYNRGQCPMPDLLVCQVQMRHTLQQVQAPADNIPGKKVTRKLITRDELVKLLAQFK